MRDTLDTPSGLCSPPRCSHDRPDIWSTATVACRWFLALCVAGVVLQSALFAQSASPATTPTTTATPTATPGPSLPPARSVNPPTPVTVRLGQQVVLHSGPCITAVDPPANGPLEIARANALMYAVYTAPGAVTTTPVHVVIDTGPKAALEGKPCESTERKRFDITVTRSPEIPNAALEQAFRILMAALVLAVLLESAFALLFNWRLFLEFFVGKAWRTPIMFAAALTIVRYFDFDLMARLFDVYGSEGRTRPYLGNVFTQTISAMVLGGGSVGVNRVLVALGFRSQVRPETIEPTLEPLEAYVAIRVRGMSDTSMYRVNMDSVDPIPADTPTTLGFVGGSTSVRARLAETLFPVRARIPRSGGLRVSTQKAYRISVTDLSDNTHYDTLGRPVATTSDSQLFAFAPKAIVDFGIRLPQKQ